ncbi:MAG: serine--tRNA ligase [Planctomycetes bacterium]|nr:serine--tRNA ligase [Planctomycetota bacterium]
MLDLDFIRSNPDKVKKAVQNKGEKANLDEVLKLDTARREVITQLDNLRARRNKASDEVAQLKKSGQDAKAIITEMKTVSADIKRLEDEIKSVEDKLQQLLRWIPNIPADDVPIGIDAKSNLEVKHWGKRAEFSFAAKPHWEIGSNLGILDSETATRIAGSGFILLKGKGARLERALINFMIDLHTQEHNYCEIAPPFMANRQSMFATGQLPNLEQDMYATKEEDMFLIPTAEVPLTNIWRDTPIPEDDLPVYYTAYTPCFRRESGSYGKDTRGIVRVHQFDKVEMVKFVQPKTSFDELEKLLSDAESVLQALGLEYRVVKLSTGDMSFASAKTYDIEAWAPGLGRYLEVSSCSNFTDFQARRGNIKFRDKNGKLKFVHTLNGSGLALPRTLICLLETYQQPDGAVEIPKVLQPYMDGVTAIKHS